MITLHNLNFVYGFGLHLNCNDFLSFCFALHTEGFNKLANIHTSVTDDVGYCKRRKCTGFISHNSSHFYDTGAETKMICQEICFLIRYIYFYLS